MTRTALRRNTLRRLMARNLTRHRAPFPWAHLVLTLGCLWPAWLIVQAMRLWLEGAWVTWP